MRFSFRHILLSRYMLLLLAGFYFLLSYVFYRYYSQPGSLLPEQKKIESSIRQTERDFFALIRDSSLLRKLIRQQEGLDKVTNLSKKKFGFYLYLQQDSAKHEMLFWNDQQVVATSKQFAMRDGAYFDSLANAYYVIYKASDILPASSKSIIAFAFLPIKYNYYIETSYLHNDFADPSIHAAKVQLSTTPTPYAIRAPGGEPLFYLKYTAKAQKPYRHPLTLILLFAGVFFFLLFVQLFCEFLSKRYRPMVGIGTLALTLLLIRLLIFFYPTLLDLPQFKLFSPTIYKSDIVHRSLGDLLINAVFFSWFVMFTWYHSANSGRYYKSISKNWKRFLGVVGLLALILTTFVFADIIKGLVADRKISFDVMNFWSLNIYSVIGFIVLACLSLGYYYFSRLLFEFLFAAFDHAQFFIFFLIGVFGLTYLTIESISVSAPRITFKLLVLCWLALYSWFIIRKGFFISRFRVELAGMLFWLFVFSVSITAVIFVENNEKDIESRKNLAESSAKDSNPTTEKLLRLSTQYIDNEFLSDNFSRFQNPDTAAYLRDSLVTLIYPVYLQTYDTQFFIFDSSRAPVYADGPASFETLNNIIDVQAHETQVPDLFYYPISIDESAYITRRVFNDKDGNLMGYCFIISNPKKNNTEASLIPELFKERRSDDADNTLIYFQAVYEKQNLKYSNARYPFATHISQSQIPKGPVAIRKNGEFSELWYRANNEKVIVIARKKDSLIEMVSLFSYLFCAFLLLVSIVEGVILVLRVLLGKQPFPRLWHLNIRSQIHSTIIFISFVSFFIIGIATISFFISRYNRNNNEKLSRTMQILVNNMESKQADTLPSLEQLVREEKLGQKKEYGLRSLVSEISAIHSVDVNVYDLDGNLLVTSQDNVYNKGIISSKMEPVAYYHLNNMRQIQHVQQESIGTMDYLSIYSPVRDAEGNSYGYVNIPYFTSENDLHQEINNFLVTIINLNAFIFLIAGVIALFVTNRITRSFYIISEKMRAVNLGKTNEVIQWNRKDEIGELVKEYNTMVGKLEDSASALAKSEREGAWREMARQVAHEIKNPLTPMKLSIQYLQKAIDNNSPNVKEMTANVARTLVEQIDHLSKIAADFSQFANIGNIDIEEFDLHDVLYSLKELYRPNHRVDLTWRPVPHKVMLHADRTQMNRLFTNLLQNAVEACADKEICEIVVKEIQVNGTVTVSISDNGEGIRPEMQSKIFVPNFTTKSSGTGLGLAMCKGIVEQAKGDIWFETKPGKGTTFFIELPVAPHDN